MFKIYWRPLQSSSHYNSRRFDLPIRSVFHSLRLSLQLRRLGYILYIYLQLILLYITVIRLFSSPISFLLANISCYFNFLSFCIFFPSFLLDQIIFATEFLPRLFRVSTMWSRLWSAVRTTEESTWLNRVSISCH